MKFELVNFIFTKKDCELSVGSKSIIMFIKKRIKADTNTRKFKTTMRKNVRIHRYIKIENVMRMLDYTYEMDIWTRSCLTQLTAVLIETFKVTGIQFFID